MTKQREQSMRVMLEIRGGSQIGVQDIARIANQYESIGFKIDPECEPVPMHGSEYENETTPQSFIVSGTISSQTEINALEAQPEVIRVWCDAKIEPFGPSY